MLLLALFWVGLGVCVGAMAVAAQLTPPRWAGRRWLATPALGAVTALLGGWLGALLLDHIFASFTALCVSVAAVGVAGLAGRMRRASAAKE